MFKSAQKIDAAFRHIKVFSIIFLIACALISGYIAYRSFRFVDNVQQHIYILANGKALEAISADRKQNIPVEARDHIRNFHNDFFTLDPDEKVIQANVTKALYLADNSAEQVYSDLKEKGYYLNLISGNVSQEINIDSISVNMNEYPYHFFCYGKEKLTRTTSIVIRSLITEGYLRNVERSDNNPHGFLIERWSIIDNKDLKTQNR